MIRKLTLFTLLITTMFMVIGCESADSNSNAYELLEQARDAMKNVDSMTLSFTSETVAPMPGADIELLIESETSGMIDVMNNSSDSFEARAEIVQEMMENEVEYTAYFRENQLYVDLTDYLGVGMREDKDFSDPFALVNFNLNFSESDVVSQTVEHVDEGRQLKFSLNDEALLETINAQLRMIDLEIDQLSDTAYTFVVLINDDYLIERIDLEISLLFESEDNEGEKTMSAHLDVELADIAFEFPEHLDEFMDLVASIPAF